MPQSLVQLYVHVVFSTKHRMPFLQDKAFRDRAFAYLAGIGANHNCPMVAVGGTADHVHALCRFGKQIALTDFIRELKRDSSRWVKLERPELNDFYWQAGYGAFSVSPSHVDSLMRYIENQEEHHQAEDYQEEFRRLCKKYGVEIDERYAWD